jgi:hypothetical protein
MERRCRPYWRTGYGPGALIARDHARDRVRGPAGRYRLQTRQASFSRTCWTTFQCRGMSSSLSVTSAPILRSRLSPHHRQVAGARDNALSGQRPAPRLAGLERGDRTLTISEGLL